MLNTSSFSELDLFYHIPKESPPYALTPWPVEESFDVPKAYNWMSQNWSISIYIGLVYLACIKMLSQWMKERKPLELTSILFYWNVALAVFSILGTLRTLPEFVSILALEDGYHKSICDLKTLQTRAFKYWVWYFILSKVAELGDTVFIVLRKRPLTFLHVYHHFSVLIFCWYTGSLFIVPPTARWYSTMNLFVHSIMYVYFAVQSLRLFRIPKAVSMTITTLQILQHVFGIAVNLHAYNRRKAGESCGVVDASLLSAAGIYFSYFVLFAWFFYKAYFGRNARRHIKAKTT